MDRLIKRGLMFGNLVPVRAEALVARYNRALEHLTGKRTALSDFHIDISGFSPEIGAELGDDEYLNPRGVNRQFILLGLEQRHAPLLNARFSTSRGILRKFIDANEDALFALTARDAVAGELVNSVYDVSDPARLFDIRTIRVEADTTGDTVATARQLGAMIDRFKTESDAWHDDVLIAQMIGLAKETGNVMRNPVTLDHMEFDQANFWSAHFGGVYVFRAVDHPAVIAMGGERDFPMRHVFGPEDRRQIAKFLQLNDLAEPIVKARGVDAAAILQQKMDFILIDHAADAGADLSGLDRRGLRGLARRFAGDLPEAYQGLAALHRWATQGGDWPRIDAEHPAYFYALRAADVPDADLVNRLLSEMSPLDPRQMFICHKEGFYDRYAKWPDTKKEYVAQFLEREYAADKAGARQALFGHDAALAPDMPARDAPTRVDVDDMIARVRPQVRSGARRTGAKDRKGPWG